MTRLSRQTDPETSREAGESVALSESKRLFLEILGTHECTAQEVGSDAHHRYGVCAETIRKRSSALVRDGLLVVVGDRKCTITGKRATVYRRARPQ